MKILFINSGIHHKNLHFILNCKKIQVHTIHNVNEINNYNLDDYDAVYSPCDPIDVSKYPNTKFIFGPQFSVFPDNKLACIKSKNSVYNLLSDWVINCWSKYTLCENLKLIKLPFGVDTERFKNTKTFHEKNKVLLYFKHRSPTELYNIEKFLKEKSIDYTIFSYDQKYNENDYISYLQETKFGIWLDAHESQGFALQEALSINVPLLVWNVTSMNQEFGQNYNNIPSTTIPYWDERCGEYFYNLEDLEKTYNLFLSKLESYKPREFILENLSFEVCEDKLIKTIENI